MWRIRPPEYPSFAREKAMLSKSPPCQQPPVTVTHQQNRIALFWLTTAVGAVLFVTLQSFSYVNDYVVAHGAMPTITFDAGALWMVSAFYGAWIVTVLLALAGTARTQWAALSLGGLMVVLNTAAGVFDGLRDGGHIAFSAVFFIALPGLCAIVAAWRHLKSKGARDVDE